MSLISNCKKVGQGLLAKDYAKAALLILLILLCSCATYHSHFIRRSDVVFSHSFYVPIALAGFWWGKRGGGWMGFLFGAILIASHSVSGLDMPVKEDALRSVMFVVVGLIVGFLREQSLRSERSLRETRDYLDSLIRYANAPIIVWNPEFRITRFNQAFEHLTGYTADEVVGQKLDMLFPEASRDASLDKIENTLSGEYWESVEIPVLRRDGDIRVALWNSANIYVPDGEALLATIAQGQDITERKRTESIVTLFWRDHVRLVVVATAIAMPLTYKLASEWLQGFAYRIDLTAVPFASAAATVALVFLSVVGVQAARIGRVRPAETLRSE